MSNTPNIRFKEFIDSWEQRKLEDYLDVSRLKNKDEQYDKEDVLSVSGDFGIVNQIEFQGRSFAGESVANYGIVEPGDIVYTKSPLKSNPYGIIKTNKGKAGIVSTLYAVYKPKKIVDSIFVQVYFEQDARMNNYMQPLVNKGAKNDMKVSAENALKGTVIFPELEEQREISDYFERLDNLISLHQRKYNAMSELKKYMLQKIFPQNGEQFPEFRFGGFTESWKRFKLGEIANKVTEKNTNLECKETLTNSAEYGIISQRDFFDHDVSNAENLGGYYIVKNEDFVYNPRVSTLAPVGPINRNKLGRNGVISPLYTVFRPHDVDNSYLEQYFKGSHWYSYMYFNGDSGVRSDRFSIKDELFFQMPIAVPSLAEQKEIGECLTNLDNLITLHKRKWDQLKNIKKFMLQNMFPKKG